MIMAAGLLALLILCLSNVGASPTMGAYIDANQNGVYDIGVDRFNITIQGAIDNALPGQTIVILPGTYHEQVTIAKDGLRIVGSGNGSTTIVATSHMVKGFSEAGTDRYPIVTAQAEDVSLSDLCVDGLDMGFANVGIAYRNSSGGLERVAVQGISDPQNAMGNYVGILVCSDGFSESSFSMRNSTVTGSLDNDMEIASENVNAILQGDRFLATPGTMRLNGVMVSDSAHLTVISCRFDSYAMSGGGSDTASPKSSAIRTNGADVVIDDCDFTHCYAGVFAEYGSVTVSNSSFQSDNIGVYLESSRAIVRNNTMTDSGYGVFANVTLGPESYLLLNFNKITGNTYGVFVEDNGGTLTLEATYNNIFGNMVGAFNGFSSVPIDMPNNWWGNVTGPGMPGAEGGGDGIPNSIDYVPWLNAPNPYGAPITTSIHQEIRQGASLDLREKAGIEVTMEGMGSANVTVERFVTDPVGPTPFISGDSFVDLRLGPHDRVGLITLKIYYDPLSLPVGILENELRLFWWNGDAWSSCTDSDVDLAGHFVFANFGADTEPSLGELTGTEFGIGMTNVTLTPDAGVKGTFTTITGSGFSVNSSVKVLLGDVQIGEGTTNELGDLRPIGIAIPQVLPGSYNLSVIDANGVLGLDMFRVLDDTPIIVTVDVGRLHFPGEVVSWYATTTINGHLVDVDSLNATLYSPNGSGTNLTSGIVRISTGVYMISIKIPMCTVKGDHAMVLNASSSGSHFGASVTVFEISPTLSGYGATLSDLRGGIATVVTTLGSIRIDMGYVNATTLSVQGRTVQIQTELGAIQGTVDDIHASIVSVSADLLRIRTDLGFVNATAKDIHTHIVSIQGAMAKIRTDVGFANATLNDIHAHVVAINGPLATIQTDLGYANATVSDIHAKVISVQGTLVSVQTDIGTTIAMLNEINATVTVIQGATAQVQTDLGSMNLTLADIHAQVITVQGTSAMIRSDLGSVNTSVNSIQARVTGIEDGMVQINSTMGTVLVSVSDVNASIDGLNGMVVTIETDLGQVQLDLNSVNARLAGLNGTMAMVHTDLGTVNASVSDIQLRAISLEGSSVTLASTLGNINGTVTGTSGALASIDTDLGQALVDIEAIQNKANGIDTSTLIGAGIFTVMAIIILMVVILRTKRK
jgi:hypothetical protein